MPTQEQRDSTTGPVPGCTAAGDGHEWRAPPRPRGVFDGAATVPAVPRPRGHDHAIRGLPAGHRAHECARVEA